MSFVLSLLLSIGEAVEQRLLVMFALVRLPGLCAARWADMWVRTLVSALDCLQYFVLIG